MMKLFKRLWKEEEGQGLVEYALIIAVVAVLIVTALITFRGKIEDVFKEIGNKLTNPAGA